MSELFSRLRAAKLVAALLLLAMAIAACGTNTETTGDQTSDSSETENSDGSEAMDDEMDGGHSHEHDEATEVTEVIEVIEVPDDMAVPEVGLRVVPDAVSGLNVFVDVTDFRISPEHASTDPVAGEGHFHLYLDGERQMRFYNTALHIDDLPEGEHEIMVELSANNHSAYAVDGQAIRVSETVTVAAAESQPDPSPYEPSEGASPSVTIEVNDDPKSGWNLFIGAENLNLSPEAAGTDPVLNEGHLHLIVDGDDQGRIYGPWWHLKQLPEGDHDIVVQVVANNGGPYLIDGERIEATTSISVTAEQAEAAMSHSHGDATTEQNEAESQSDVTEGMDERGPVLADANLRIDVSLEGDDVAVESDRFQVPRNFTVTVVVESDRVEHVHVHGYDLLAAVAPGSPAEIIFEADVLGVFEVELEDSGLFLFEIAVVE